MNMINAGTQFNQRDIVFVPFPYSDLSTSKKRPALIISDEEYHKTSDDVLCCLITSNPRPYRYAVFITTTDLDYGNLAFDSKIKPDRIFSLHRSKIIRKYARLNKEKSRKVIEIIDQIIKIKD